MMNEELRRLVDEYLQSHGEDDLARLLGGKLAGENSSILTIVSDDTFHQIPNDLIHGDRFVFSNGNFDLSDESSLTRYLEERVVALYEVLSKKRWKKVRLIFSGHAVLAATIKLVVYRVAHLETEDVIYFGGHGYMEISLKLRELLASRS